MQRELLEKARALVLKTNPDCDESVEWGVICYCEGEIFEGSGKTARYIKIYSEKEMGEKTLPIS